MTSVYARTSWTYTKDKTPISMNCKLKNFYDAILFQTKSNMPAKFRMLLENLFARTIGSSFPCLISFSEVEIGTIINSNEESLYQSISLLTIVMSKTK